MKAEQLSNNILSLDSNIRFAGILEKSGHLYAGGTRGGVTEYLKGRDSEISFSQTAYIVDLRKMFTTDLGDLEYIVYVHKKVKIFSMPVKDHILVFSTSSDAVDIEDITNRVLDYIKSVETQLSLYPPSNVINPEKREAVKNLHDSGISEELIAEQLDLSVDTVKVIVKETGS
ncbi:MAG: DUF6659 family protein [Nitrososphaeraceae archaeon]|jgi:hypothetical protein